MDKLEKLSERTSIKGLGSRERLKSQKGLKGLKPSEMEGLGIYHIFKIMDF